MDPEQNQNNKSNAREKVNNLVDGARNKAQQKLKNKAMVAIKNKGKDIAKKAGKEAVKKAALWIIGETAPIWGALLLLVFMVFVVAAILNPQNNETKPVAEEITTCIKVDGAKCMPAGTECNTQSPAMDTLDGLTCANDTDVCCAPKEETTVTSGDGSIIFFMCQYGRVNARGSVIPGTAWAGCSSNGFCTPTSIAMIMNSYIYSSYIKSPKYTPITVRDGGGLRSEGCLLPNGSGPWDYERYIKNNGYSYSQTLLNGGRIRLSQVANYLKNGYLITAGAHITWWQNSGTGNADRSHGHAFVIAGISGNDLIVYDPTYCENGKRGGKRILKDVNNLGTGSIGSAGWSYARAIKKK